MPNIYSKKKKHIFKLGRKNSLLFLFFLVESIGIIDISVVQGKKNIWKYHTFYQKNRKIYSNGTMKTKERIFE